MPNNKKPNIILIVVDSLRYDHIGLTVNNSSITPNIDSFSKRSIYFTQAISQGSSTPPAMKSLLSSTYPNEFDGPQPRLHKNRPVLQTFLKQSGYTTAAIVTNLYISLNRGWERDFDYFDDCDLTLLYKQAFIFRALAQPLKILRTSLDWPLSLPAETLFKKSFSWIKHCQFPFFLLIHTMDVHWPYNIQQFSISPRWQINQKYNRIEIKPRLISEKPTFSVEEHDQLAKQYIDAVHYTDFHLGNFINKLRKNGLLENTILIITSDHGESLGDHDRYFHSSHLFDELIHVPLIIYLPPSLEPLNRHYSHQVRLIDIVPTIFDLISPPIKNNEFCRGRSLATIFKGEQEREGNRPAISEAYTGEDYAIRWKGWKLIYNTKSKQSQLFNLIIDPDEMQSVSDMNPDILNNMQSLLDIHIKNEKRYKFSEGNNDNEDSAIINRMRDLGYMD